MHSARCAFSVVTRESIGILSCIAEVGYSWASRCRLSLGVDNQTHARPRLDDTVPVHGKFDIPMEVREGKPYWGYVRFAAMAYRQQHGCRCEDCELYFSVV